MSKKEAYFALKIDGDKIQNLMMFFFAFSD